MGSPEPTPGGLRVRPLTAREKTLIIFAFLLIYAVGFVFWIYRPFTEKIADLRVQLAEERSKLENARTVLHRLEDIEARIAELTKEMQQLDLMVPGDNRVPEFLYACWQWERATGARVRDMTFGAVAATGSYEEYSVNFTVVGTYEAQVGFLARLEGMNRLVRVDSVRLLPQDTSSGGEAGGQGAGGGQAGAGGSTGGTTGGAGTGTPSHATADVVTANYVVHLFVDPGKAAQVAQEIPGKDLIFTLPVGRRTPFLP